MVRAARKDSALGLALILTAAIAWGTIPLVLEAAAAVHPVVVVFYRVGISALILLGVAPFTGTFRELKTMPSRVMLGLAVNGILLAVNWVLFFSGLRLAGVAIGEILGYTGPVWVAVLLPLFMKERFDRRVVVPLALALSGTVAVLMATAGHETGSSVALGSVLAFASSLTYSTLILNAKRLLAGVGTVTLMLMEYLVAAALLSPALLFLPGPSTLREWTALATLATGLTVATGFIFLSGLRRVRADHGAILTYGEPVSAVMFGAAFLGQQLTPLVILGGALVVCGGIIVARMEPTSAIEAPSLVADATL